MTIKMIFSILLWCALVGFLLWWFPCFGLDASVSRAIDSYVSGAI